MMGRPTRWGFNHLVLAVVALGLTLALALGAARLLGEPALGERLAAKAGVPRPAVVAHRGASYWAPEATRAAYVLARELGADYLEVDLQRTRDHVLVAMHDRTPARVTDVAKVFPERATAAVEAFTFPELQRLDAGGWFNDAFPERARSSFRGLRILRLEDVLEIAGGRSPPAGLCIELKRPHDFPGIEGQVLTVLAGLGWVEPAPREGSPSASGTDGGRGRGRVVLQSFDRPSLTRLKRLAPGVPRILLLSEGTVGGSSWASILEGAAQVAMGVGPWGSRPAQGPQGSDGASAEPSLVTWPWRIGQAHRAGLLVHPWTIDDAWEMRMLRLSGADGLFTNRPERALAVFGRSERVDMEKMWKQIGY